MSDPVLDIDPHLGAPLAPAQTPERSFVAVEGAHIDKVSGAGRRDADARLRAPRRLSAFIYGARLVGMDPAPVSYAQGTASAGSRFACMAMAGEPEAFGR